MRPLGNNAALVFAPPKKTKVGALKNSMQRFHGGFVGIPTDCFRAK
ncbi:hypothetical protein LBBP_02123 [Leptospira borgpetersenii serovar Ballum]|uniref:Uncharacterized protein n=1 Tax=Leptospira borgpetersenii serovar Ballum TaxID=280505 RepID=A0A0S2IRU1_LEPBO|nr:hypothetical protein LBBP_02123 [Leptospira borgpetersenii serovar Ballum]